MVEERLPGHGRDIAALQTRGILIDGNTRNGQKKLLPFGCGTLLQLFERCTIQRVPGAGWHR